MAEETKQKNLAALSLGALGVVFGDIGTNPLYAVRQCFQNLNERPVPAEAVLGILSLIFWSLIVVVCVKYLTFILSADHEGEGGTLAMLALIQTKRPHRPTAKPTKLILLVLLGSALLYGDGVITPAISVLSAVEGLKVATPTMEPYVVPLSVAILLSLFLLQHRGSGRIGFLFGPVMLIWFGSVLALGVIGMMKAPQVLWALNPLLGLVFLTQHGWTGLFVLGGVVLCFSGAEALFADVSHFGKFPIRLTWYALVLPALVANFFGQGALILLHPAQTANPFYLMVPPALVYPMVALATAATGIASQALISGVFTLTEQAIHMGYFPPFEIRHTSETEKGQVYIAPVNYLLMIACILIVMGFRSSERLGSAYGLAVMGTMAITSLTFFVVLRSVWKWPVAGAALLVGAFLVIDLAFLAGNIPKLEEGAWVPLAIGLVVFAVFWIWTACHARAKRALETWSLPIEEFKHEVNKWKDRPDGTGVFLTTHPDSVPLVGKNLWLREHVQPEQLVLVTVLQEIVPYLTREEMSKVEELGPGFVRVTASFGFMQHPDVNRILKELPQTCVKIEWDRLVCYLPEIVVMNKPRCGWLHHQANQIYAFLRRNATSPAKYFRVPPREIVHVGVRLEL